MIGSGNYPILNSDPIHPGEGTDCIRIAGQLYSYQTLDNIVGGSFLLACRDYGSRHPNKTHQERMEGVLIENGIPLTPGGEATKA